MKNLQVTYTAGPGASFGSAICSSSLAGLWNLRAMAAAQFPAHLPFFSLMLSACFKLRPLHALTESQFAAAILVLLTHSFLNTTPF